MIRSGPPLFGAALFLGSLLVVSSGRGQGADDETATAALVGQLAQDSAQGPVTADALSHARQALERATRLRAAGDEVHAKAADALAREWAETARDVTRASQAESAALELRRKALDSQAGVERTRALVEEAIARVGRLSAELEEAGRNAPKEKPTKAAGAGSRP